MRKLYLTDTEMYIPAKSQNDAKSICEIEEEGIVWEIITISFHSASGVLLLLFEVPLKSSLRILLEVCSREIFRRD